MTEKRILLVEDHSLWIGLVRREIDGLDVELVVATDYQEALQALRKGPYDLLILDNNLNENRNVSVELMQMARRFLKEMPKVIVHSDDLPLKTKNEAIELGGECIDKGTGLREAVVRLLA